MKKRITLRSVEEYILKIKNYINWSSVIGVGYICLYQIESLRRMCKIVCQYLIDSFLFVFNVEISHFKSLYFMIESVFHVLIICSVLSTVLMFILNYAWDRWLRKQEGSNRFEQSLFRYLHTASGARCFLVSGKWGAGKTYEVQQFVDKYYRHSKTQVYRISCFGLDSREKIIKEINSVIEQNDDSFSAQVINFVEYIPVIGELFAKLFKKTYSYTSVAKDSIFIFDDFERLTSRTVGDRHKAIYEPSPFLLSNTTIGFGRQTEFSQIKDEFGNISRSFQQLDYLAKESLDKADNDKYIAVVGIINDLIETYGMKAIIICNSDILGEKFIHDVLRSKLNCMEYKKTISSEVKSSILNQQRENITLSDSEKQKCICEYLEIAESPIENCLQKTVFDNMRLYSGVIEAFINTANLFERKVLTQDFLTSLLNSIIIVHLSYYEDSVSWLECLKNGMNIDFGVLCFGGKGSKTSLIRLNNNSNEVKFISPDVSGYWVFNMMSPNLDHIRQVYKEWENYEYCDLEYRMMGNLHTFQDESNFDILHVLAYLANSNENRRKEWDCKKAISVGLAKYDLSQIDTIIGLLDYADIIFKGGYSETVITEFFEKLSEGNATGNIPIHSFMHRNYLDYLKKQSYN